MTAPSHSSHHRLDIRGCCCVAVEAFTGTVDWTLGCQLVGKVESV
jgi:hypothetical protein